jgi:hypothetical protein
MVPKSRQTGFLMPFWSFLADFMGIKKILQKAAKIEKKT